MASKNHKKTVKKAAKEFKKMPMWGKIAIVIVLIAAIGLLGYAYNKNPEFFDKIRESFYGTSGDINGSNDGSTSGGTQDGELTLDENELQIHFLDVGQGDCILILLPDGKDMIIDCGNKSSDYNYADTAAYLSNYITDGQLDYLMLTHGDEDHVEFLDNIIETYHVNNIYMPNILAEPTNVDRQAEIASLPAEKVALFTDGDTLTSAMYAEFFYAALSEEGANIILNIGQFSIVGTSYRIDFYCLTQAEWDSSNLNSAEKKNAVSPIGVLQYNGKKVVLTGDSNEINEPYFMSAVGGTELDCDVLKVAHHGSETSSTAAFLDYIKCEYAVISCNAAGNTFHHPRQDTLDRLAARNMTVYRTDLNGTIVLSITADGLSFTMDTQTEQNVEFVGAPMD